MIQIIQTSGCDVMSRLERWSSTVADCRFIYIKQGLSLFAYTFAIYVLCCLYNWLQTQPVHALLN